MDFIHMGEVMELNREEITRLSRMNDVEGHGWALYLLLKRHMENYTGTVHIDIQTLVKVFTEKYLMASHQENPIKYIKSLLNQLVKVEIISEYHEYEDTVSSVLPIAFGDVCIESDCQH